MAENQGSAQHSATRNAALIGGVFGLLAGIAGTIPAMIMIPFVPQKIEIVGAGFLNSEKKPFTSDSYPTQISDVIGERLISMCNGRSSCRIDLPRMHSKHGARIDFGHGLESVQIPASLFDQHIEYLTVKYSCDDGEPTSRLAKLSEALPISCPRRSLFAG